MVRAGPPKWTFAEQRRVGSPRTRPLSLSRRPLPPAQLSPDDDITSDMRKCSQVQKQTEPRPAAPSSAAVWGLPGPVCISDASSESRVPLLSLALS
ncbi:unnamed protein product [Rangifer tarandus platyrhynchus]|uniref:Uncharacterized protein n=1 Tax=Rangifer tarandus platyrhynchus TaxID=3082113 RepID=A0AC59ZMW2_RANTA